MKKIQKYIFLICLFLLVASGYSQNRNQLKIIVNKDNAITSISQDQLSRLFLKKTTKWSAVKTA